MDVRDERGGVLALVAIFMVVLVGIAALAIDSGNLRAHRRQLQSAADAAALAGAANLPPIGTGADVCGDGSLSDRFARENTRLTSDRNLVVNDNLDTSYCQILGPTGSPSVRVWPNEGSVPFLFAGVLGFTETDVSARARARIVYLTRTRGLMPLGVENLQPTKVEVIVDRTGQTVELGLAGCSAPTPEGFPYWCGGAEMTDPGAGGSTVSLRVTDQSGKVITWSGVGYLGSDLTFAGCAGAAGACGIRDVTVSPVGDPHIYYTSTAAPKAYGVSARLVNVPADAQVKITADRATVTLTAPTSGTRADGVWTTSNAAFTSAGDEGPVDIEIELDRPGNNDFEAAVQQVYARDDSNILQQWVQSRHYVSPAATGFSRYVEFSAAFLVLTRGREITLKLGGGGAQGNSGNYASLDLDTNTSWGQYACYDSGGAPNLRDEIEHGSCTPYAIGDPVETQTGNSAGQVEQGLAARIDGSPSLWTSIDDPPPSGDPRWVNVILVPPLTYSSATGTETTQVTGFGSFYITEYSGDPGSSLRQGEVRGVFRERVNPATGAYSLTCNDPSGICLTGIALVPWD